MWKRLRAWYAVPPAEQRAERLRWTRRVSLTQTIVGTPLAAAIAAWNDASAWVLWALLGVGLYGLYAGYQLRKPIAEAERRGPATPDEVQAGRRRGMRAAYGLALVLLVTFPVIGYVALGVGGAIFFLVGALACGALGVAATRRLLD